ncbi:MAG TPA: TPM domain-containing protein, partial [Crocinitomicaceae bacterium]|nr:TPM domain-containing protein [Crocinitomicaceae bacterium]
MTRSRDFFTSEQQAQLISAIQEAEKNTSGEIRLHIDTTCDSDVVQRTLEVFDQLKMGETQLKNGVLFYLAI